jgi:hypothetical protein
LLERFNDGSQLSEHARSAFLGIGYPTILNGSNRQQNPQTFRREAGRCSDLKPARCRKSLELSCPKIAARRDFLYPIGSDRVIRSEDPTQAGELGMQKFSSFDKIVDILYFAAILSE